MTTAAPARGSYLSREESFMYDRETKFKMHDTMNAARIEYTENGVLNMAQRRCDIVQISQSSALLGIMTQFKLPQQFYLDIPDARIMKIGCLLSRTNANNTVLVRFLRLLSDKELKRIFIFSTHPNHKDLTIDVRAW